MKSRTIQNILKNYQSENAGVKRNLANILSAGNLGGTGKLVILPVDQGFEHGPAKSFAPNPPAYDPNYHIQLAIEAGLSAYAAPLGMLEMVADEYAGQIPLILKMNSANSLNPEEMVPNQAITASVDDALRLGCSAIGMTVYPGSSDAMTMMEEIAEVIREAKEVGLAVVLWSYARGEDLTKDDETALDVIAYCAHIAALLGANIIKVKPPTNKVRDEKTYSNFKDINNLSARVAHVKQAAFNGKRLVIFSGGASKKTNDLSTEISELAQGGADGSIIGRNAFQRPHEEAIQLLKGIMETYKNANNKFPLTA